MNHFHLNQMSLPESCSAGPDPEAPTHDPRLTREAHNPEPQVEWSTK